MNTLGLDKETLLKELADAVIGDYYPTPSRCLPCTETILNAYLQSALYNGADLADETNIWSLSEPAMPERPIRRTE